MQSVIRKGINIVVMNVIVLMRLYGIMIAIRVFMGDTFSKDVLVMALVCICLECLYASQDLTRVWDLTFPVPVKKSKSQAVNAQEG